MVERQQASGGHGGRDGKCSRWVAAISHSGKQESGRWQQGFFSVFVVAKGWGLRVARLLMLMVVIWLEGGGIGDSRWVCEFGRVCVWFEI